MSERVNTQAEIIGTRLRRSFRRNKSRDLSISNRLDEIKEVSMSDSDLVCVPSHQSRRSSCTCQDRRNSDRRNSTESANSRRNSLRNSLRRKSSSWSIRRDSHSSISEEDNDVIDPDQPLADSPTLQLMFYAVQYNDTTLLKNILRQSSKDINTLNEDGISALHFAAMVGNHDCIRLLHDYGACLNLMDVRGQLPLHYALMMDKIDAARCLVDLGADVKTCSDLPKCLNVVACKC